MKSQQDRNRMRKTVAVPKVVGRSRSLEGGVRLVFLFSMLGAISGGAVRAADIPEFLVPGFEEDMRALNELHALHHEAAFTPCTLWDAWLPMATLWASEKKRAQHRASLLNRRIDAEGYVSMQQHRGMAENPVEIINEGVTSSTSILRVGSTKRIKRLDRPELIE